MNVILKSFLYLGLFIVGCFALIEFFIWMESDKYDETKSKIQLLPFELGYVYTGEDEGYKKADSLYVTLYIENDQQELEVCSEPLVSREHYEKLLNLLNKLPSSTQPHIIARVYEQKIFGQTCDVAVGDWDQFLNMKQPSKEAVKKYNDIQSVRQMAAEFKEKYGN